MAFFIIIYLHSNINKFEAEKEKKIQINEKTKIMKFFELFFVNAVKILNKLIFPVTLFSINLLFLPLLNQTSSL